MAWCQTVLRNLLRQSLRREWYGCITQVGLDDRTAGQVDPWRQVDERLALEGVLERLDERQERAAREFYLHGRSIRDLAAQWQRPVGTIKRWLHESREAMRMSLVEGAPQKAYLYGGPWPQQGKAALTRALRTAGYEVVAIRAVDDAVWPEDAALFVLAERVAPATGLEVLLNLRAQRPGVPTLLFGSGRRSAAYAAWQAGADIYLTQVDEAEVAGLLGQLQRMR